MADDGEKLSKYSTVQDRAKQQKQILFQFRLLERNSVLKEYRSKAVYCTVPLHKGSSNLLHSFTFR